MCSMLIPNEKAYFKRYGISLNEILSNVSDSDRNGYLKLTEDYINKPVPRDYFFKNDEILRIIIGYQNAAQLKIAFENATAAVKILLWEPDAAIFAAGCIYEDLSTFIEDERFYILLEDGVTSLKREFSNTIFDNNILHRHIFTFGKYIEQDNKEVKLFIKVFEDYCVDLASQMHFRKQYEQMVYENVIYSVSILNNNTTIQQISDNIPTRDIPVIIVAAGPSLMKNCTELKRAKNRSIIIAVAHSMKTLSENGIHPDVIATMDPASPFFLDFEGAEDNMLLSCVCGNKEFQKAYDGKVIFYGFPMFNELFSSERTDLEPLAELDTGSVATDVLSIFEATGFKRFILVGQDLAYGKDGSSHTGSQKEMREKDKDGIYPETEGIDGTMLRTRDDWVLFRKYYEKRIQSDPLLDIIDATEGGALIHGSRVMRLCDAIDMYCVAEYPVGDWIANAPKGSKNEKEYIDEWFSGLLSMNQRTAVNLERLLLLSSEIIETWNDRQSWNDDFSAKCRRYDIMYKVVLEGEDAKHLREYCRADLERYIEDALVLEGDDNVEVRMKREHELFLVMYEKLMNMQTFISEINL